MLVYIANMCLYICFFILCLQIQINKNWAKFCIVHYNVQVYITKLKIYQQMINNALGKQKLFERAMEQCTVCNYS